MTKRNIIDLGTLSDAEVRKLLSDSTLAKLCSCGEPASKNHIVKGSPSCPKCYYTAIENEVTKYAPNPNAYPQFPSTYSKEK